MDTRALVERTAEANGISIHYLEMGSGYPLLVLHGGTASTSAVWDDHPWGIRPHLPTFAAHFHVFALDTRGHGRTSNPTQALSFQEFARDVLAFIDALHLERPLIYGFSDGGVTASLIAIQYPDRLLALVNHAGCDLFLPEPPALPYIRSLWGGSPTATAPDFEHIERTLSTSDWLGRIRRDQTASEDAWKTHLRGMFQLWTTPIGVPIADFARIEIPCLLMVGDRDQTHELEDVLRVYRQLSQGALAIMPNTAHAITPAVCVTSTAFLEQAAMGAQEHA
jgi:pimeloyl-ACP methyl ester carboxylesterase